MEEKQRKYVDWEKTGKNLQFLRSDNLKLRKYVCYKLNYDKGQCSGDCDGCRYEMDNSISRAELSKIFNVSESVINNWETAKTHIDIENLLYYCEIAEVEAGDVLVFYGQKSGQKKN